LFKIIGNAIEQGDWVTARVSFSQSMEAKDFTAIPEKFLRDLKSVG
jgi:hypothetical protein